MLYQFLFFYTDGHDFNEDIRTISHLGGRWNFGSSCGLFRRVMADVPSMPGDHVASRLTIREAFCSSYTDWHEINEDSVTISISGGWLGLDSRCGLFFRNLADTPSNANDGFASRLTLRVSTLHGLARYH